MSVFPGPVSHFIAGSSHLLALDVSFTSGAPQTQAETSQLVSSAPPLPTILGRLEQVSGNRVATDDLRLMQTNALPQQQTQYDPFRPQRPLHSKAVSLSEYKASHKGCAYHINYIHTTEDYTMAERERSGDKVRPPPLPSRTKMVRSQKIITLSPAEGRPQDIPEDSEPPREAMSTRSHTPGQLATKSSSGRKGSHSHSSSRDKDSGSRSRSQSVSSSKPSTSSTPIPKLSSQSNASSRPPSRQTSERPSSRQTSERPQITSSQSTSSLRDQTRPIVLRSTSAITTRSHVHTPVSTPRPPTVTYRSPAGPATTRPPIPSTTGPDVLPAPASGMYWSLAPTSGHAHTSLRAHTTTIIGSTIYIFGGCDSKSCFNHLYTLDADSFTWSSPLVHGELPVALRAMTCTAVGRKLIVFGGGDGPAYYNDVYVLDTVNFRWSKPKISGLTPSKRRAHTACLYRNGIYVFGGGDGVRALNDIWRLDVTDVDKMSWKLISPPTSEREDANALEKKPKARGYHTANIVGSKLIIFGGSDGGECFRDVWVFDVELLTWKSAIIPISFPRLSHTATIVGSYLFVIGGHDGVEYSNEVLLLNLVTMQWDKRKIYGCPPSGRGYHGSILHDSRVIVTGGFDGGSVFKEVWVLELAVHAYYSQISHFTIEV